MEDFDKYVLEQAKIEVEHTRSWPTKVLAFYVAINAGLVTALFALSNRTPSVQAPWCTKALLTAALGILFIWVLVLLAKNHRSYLRYRAIQVQYQVAHTEQLKKHSVPAEWFAPIEVSLCTRALGWSFYAFIALLVAALTITGVWVS